MDHSAVTNREFSALLLLLVFLVLVLVFVRKDASLRSSIGKVSESLREPAIWVPLILYLFWIAGIVALAKKAYLWNVTLLKATILWVILAGFGFVFDLNDAIKKPGFFGRALKRAVGVLALVEFLVSLKSFPIWLELPGQGLALVFGLVGVVAEREPQYGPVKRLANGYLTFFGFGALGWSIYYLLKDRSMIDLPSLGQELLLPVWLTGFALMFVYAFAVVAAYQGAFLRMRFWKKDGPQWKQRLALLLRSHIRLGRLRLWNGAGLGRIANAGTFRSAWREMSALRAEDEERRAEEAAATRRLVENAGVIGADEEGRQLDQREFAETCDALQWLASCEMGHYRSRQNRYHSDVLSMAAVQFPDQGLPQDHGVEIHISFDGQSWYATRQTITGWWFAIGAAGPPADQWLYDGSTPPKGFPKEPEWDRFGDGPSSANWIE